MGSGADWHPPGGGWVASPVVPRAPRARFVAGVVLLATVLALVPASTVGAATASPDQWTGAVCGALDSWVHDVHAAAEKVATSRPTSARNVRTKLTKLLALSQRETAALLAALKKAGQPDVKGGKQIAATLREGFVQVQRTVVDARKTLAKASTKDPKAFMDATRSVQDSLEAGLEGVQAAFSAARTADVGPLLTAFAANKHCRHVAE
jgi:hypothetical protein